MFSNLLNIILNFSHSFGYGGIFLLMVIESSFIPFPSEIIIPPAAYLASQGGFNIYLVVFWGILGSLLGAIINYYLAYFLGRLIIYKISDWKISRFLLINSQKIKKAEDFYLKHGNISTFVGRLLPVIRQLISLPAGFSKMNFRDFLFFTFLGSGIWVSFLAYLGYQFGARQDLFFEYYKIISFSLLLIFFIIYFVYKKRKNKF